jgi:membrane-bound ClpP family serine protease
MRSAGTHRNVVVAAILIGVGAIAFVHEAVAHTPSAPLIPILGALAFVAGLAVLFVATEQPYRSPSLTG